MDIFGDDIDSILGNDDLNKNIHSYDELDAKETDENDEEQKEEGTSKTVDPKRRTVRKPQLRLNVERLMNNDRGIHTLERYFQNIKYCGKGYEKDDLDNVLKRIEHWAHRLYPKFNFRDFLATTEQLGKKKQLQTHMQRYRHGLLEPVVDGVVLDNENDEIMPTDQPFDDIDELLGQQIEKYKTATSLSTTNNNTSFDSVRSSVITTPRFMGRPPIEASTPMMLSMSGIQSLETTPSQPPQTKLTSEQMALIATNRQKALEKLKARREAAANAACTTSNINNENNDT